MPCRTPRCCKPSLHAPHYAYRDRRHGLDVFRRKLKLWLEAGTCDSMTYAALRLRFTTAATFFMSSTRARICACRESSSTARKTDDGCTVAITTGARDDSMSSPRRRLTLKSFP